MHFLRSSMSSGTSDTIPHSHLTGTCPVTGQTHEWCPPQPGDSRSPCPALNVLSNHGYLPRSGKGITFVQIAKALAECYGLYMFFAYFLAFGGMFLLRQWGPICLADIARHGAVEHDASLAHKDTPPGDVYAPLEIDEDMLEESMGWMTEECGDDGLISAEDVARTRVYREKYSKPLDGVHAEIARGEMGVPLLIFAPSGSTPGAAPAEYIHEWIGQERLPLGGTWRPERKIGLLATVMMSKRMKNAMVALRAKERGRADAGVFYVEPLPPSPYSIRVAPTTKKGPPAVVAKSPISYGSLNAVNGHRRQISGSSSSSIMSDDILPSGHRAHQREETPPTEVDAEEPKLHYK